MNKRIQELAEQAGFKVNWQHEDVQAVKMARFEKFAELIVKECCDVLYDNELGGYQTNYVLKEHFGVEE